MNRQPGNRPISEPAELVSSPAPARSFTTRERIVLTIRYHGVGSLALRAITYPLRFTPLRGLLNRRHDPHRSLREKAARWYARHGRPVTIVIPSFRDAGHVANLVVSLRATTRPEMVRIIVPDDDSGLEHLEVLRRVAGIEVIVGESNRGFAANVNRGLRAAGGVSDVVLLNSDVIAQPGWLETLQYAAQTEPDVGVVGAKLLYPDGRIQFAGTIRNPDAPEWFDHRYRFKPADWGPANVGGWTLAVTGACMYITRDALSHVGEFDESYEMAYEDVDYCLRAWQAGYGVRYAPEAQLLHLESVTRGATVRERERASQRLFWERWGSFMNRRDVRTDDGRLRVVYVTEDTGVGGGPRALLGHLNSQQARGHEGALWCLGARPSWFQLNCPVRTFVDYGALAKELVPLEAIKVATWWRTADPVFRASVTAGIPVFFVQDIETSYYPSGSVIRDAVIDSYRPEFRYMTISSWNRDRLRELGLEAELIRPGNVPPAAGRAAERPDDSGSGTI